jgi:O-antigen ligase
MNLREKFLSLVAAVMLLASAWLWGGVVLWVQWLLASLGLTAFAIAVYHVPRATLGSCSPQRSMVPFVVSGFIGGVIWFGYRIGSEVANHRAIRQIAPEADLPTLPIENWVIEGLLAASLSAALLAVIMGLVKSEERRRRLFAFAPFWAGLAIFAWIGSQALNNWGVVIQRELFWSISPNEYISWLPSGIKAPFDSTEEPGGMNAWRQMLLLAGPWLLFCALCVEPLRRKSLIWLASLSCLSSLGLAIVGAISRAERWRDFLGFSAIDDSARPYGPFVYVNHGAVYLYLCAGLAFAMMFHLVRRHADKVDQGGPHLIAGFAGMLLVVAAITTTSLGAAVLSAILFLVCVPIAYYLDRRLRGNLSWEPAIGLLVLGAIAGYSVLSTGNFQKWARKLDMKYNRFEETGMDDRAPIRNATWESITSAPTGRQIFGWGGGSYRWISPAFMAGQPAFIDKKGDLVKRATHAHNDWLQMIAEWGLAGWAICAFVIGIHFGNLRRCIMSQSSEALILWMVISLYLVHMFFDFLMFPPHLVIIGLIYIWLNQILESQEQPLMNDNLVHKRKTKK